MSDPRRRILHNPFYVLGLSVQASRAEVEREGQKLLGMLALGLSAACTYNSPLGPAPRTPEAVREAMAELRDPERRLVHELWARVPAVDAAGAAGTDAGARASVSAVRWPDALAALGWRPPGQSGGRRVIWLLLTVLVAFVRLVGIIRHGQEQSPAEGFVLLWSALVLATTLFGVGALAGVWWCLPCVLAGLVLLAPWTVTRRVLIPLGLPRAACHLGALAGWTWKRDRHGGGLIAGAWAIARQRTPDRAAIDWLAARRDRQPTFQATQVLATGLLTAARGDLPGARRLLESVGEIGPQRTPRTVHALAREWLVADAAAQGAWRRAVRLARRARASTRTVRLLAGVGARLAQVAPVPAAWSLWLSWAVAPHRRHTLALVRQAVRTAPASATRGASAIHALTTSLQPDPHTDALVTHVAVLRGQLGSSRGQALRSLAQAWDRALADPETGRAIRQRAAALGARSGDSALAVLGDTVARDLADMARAHDLPIATWRCDSHTLREAERLLREQLIGEVELAFDAVADRVAQNRRLLALDEWREWLSLRALHAHAAGLGGLELRRLVFPHVHHIACKMAVWLWNERGQHFLANAMFRWLLDEAVAVGDAEAIELQRRNWDDSY